MAAEAAVPVTALPSMSIAADASNSYIDDGGVQDAMMSVEAGISSTESKTTATQQDNSIYDDSKLILNGRIIAEATDFDSAISAIEQQVLNAGGYIENSSVSGNIGDHWGMFTIRVPRGKFESVFEVVGENCHVTERSRSSENVSTTYYDTEARKTALETNRDRLLVLLEKADNMEYIIALESALSDVQYQIEGLSGTLRNYDRLITFSTIDVYLSEVRDLTIVQEEDTFLSDLKAAAVTGTRGLIHVVQSLILPVVSGWWIFLGIATLIMLTRRRLRRPQKQVSKCKVPPPPSAVLEQKNEDESKES